MCSTQEAEFASFHLQTPQMSWNAAVVGMMEVPAELSFLCRCPHLFSVDLSFFVKSFHRLEQPVLALACVCLLPSSQEKEAFVKVRLTAGWRRVGANPVNCVANQPDVCHKCVSHFL